MDEDQWYALSKSQQSADWQQGFEAAKAAYIPVLMEHLRILADLRAQVEALRDQAQSCVEDDSLSQATQNIWKTKALAYARIVALLDGAQR